MTLKSWFYDQFVAHKYDAQLAEYTQEFRRICIERAAVAVGETVLDLGCGTGLNQPLLAEQVGARGKIIGVDASPKMLDQAKQRATELGYTDRLELIQGDIRNIDKLIGAPVDRVIATLIFSVVPDWRLVFEKSYGLLQAGGGYGIVDNYWPNPGLRLWLLSWGYAADAKRPGFEPLQSVAADFHLDYLPPDEDIQFYVASGFKPVDVAESAR